MNIVALFDMSGYSLQPWAEAGFSCYCLDIVNNGNKTEFASGGFIHFLQWDANEIGAKNFIYELAPRAILSFPPCTHLASSGAKHFARKLQEDPTIQKRALDLVLLPVSLAEKVIGCPWLVENPVGIISTEWKKPDYIYNPCEYGGYLSPDDKHPKWPQYIAARDGYMKKTCIWHGNGFRQPPYKTVPFQDHHAGFNHQTALLGGKSLRTKQIRSLTPRGWARAIFEANHEIVRDW